METPKSTVTTEKYREHYDAWKQSGQNKLKFCAGREINYTSFLYWIKKNNKTFVENKSNSHRFQQLQITGSNGGDCCFISLLFPNRCEIKIYQRVEASFVTQLISLCK